MKGRMLHVAAVGAVLVLAFLFLRDGEGERPTAGDTRPPAPDGPAAGERSAGGPPERSASLASHEPSRAPSAVRDIELALEAAVSEREAAVYEVQRAQQALEAVEEQLSFRIDQGEAPDDLTAEAEAALAAPFRELQTALRRLDQAKVSENALREQLAAAGGSTGPASGIP
jgi:hypothetical protein